MDGLSQAPQRTAHFPAPTNSNTLIAYYKTPHPARTANSVPDAKWIASDPSAGVENRLFEIPVIPSIHLMLRTQLQSQIPLARLLLRIRQRRRRRKPLLKIPLPLGCIPGPALNTVLLLPLIPVQLGIHFRIPRPGTRRRSVALSLSLSLPYCTSA